MQTEKIAVEYLDRKSITQARLGELFYYRDGTLHGVKQHLGVFATKEEAHHAYQNYKNGVTNAN